MTCAQILERLTCNFNRTRVRVLCAHCTYTVRVSLFDKNYFTSQRNNCCALFNHSQNIITKCDGIITNCDSLVYYKVRWTVITNCDSFFITKCDKVYYKLRQVLQSAMDLLQIATVHTSLMLPSVCVIGVHGSIAFYRMRSRDLSSELKERS